MTDSQRNDGIQTIREKFGWSGLGRLFIIMEMIADKMCPENNYAPILIISKKELRRHLTMTAPRLHGYLTAIQSQLNLEVTETEDKFTLNYPKMLKLKDNNAYNLKVTSKSLKSNLDLELELEKEKDIVVSEQNAHISPTAENGITPSNTTIQQDCSIEGIPLKQKHCDDAKQHKNYWWNDETQMLEIPEDDLYELYRRYDKDFVLLRLKPISNWLYANPKRRKKDYKKFIVNWLNRDLKNEG
jgi:hypothetical protein